MKIIDRNITAWQTGILLFILLFANKVLVLPSLLYEGAKFEAFLIPIIASFLEFGLLFLFYKVKMRFPDKSFEEILSARFGKVVQILIYIFFSVYFLAKAVLLYNVTFIFFRNMIYKNAQNFVFLFALLPIINHLAICGLRVLGRTAQLFLPVIFLITVFCIVVGCFGIDSNPLLFQTNATMFFSTFFKNFAPFGDSILLFMIIDRVKVERGQWKPIFILSALALLCVCVITFVFILSYSHTCFMHPFAIFEIMSFVKEYEGLGRLDLISMVVIILYTYFQLAIYLKVFMFSFCGVFKKLDVLYSVLTFNILFLIIINFFITNLDGAVFFGQNLLPYFNAFPFVVLPTFVLLLFVRRRKREVKT